MPKRYRMPQLTDRRAALALLAESDNGATEVILLANGMAPTAKGKYGLKALVRIAALPSGETIQATDIAEATNIPKKFLDAILGELRNAGIVYSKKGPGGGYMLAREPEQIQIGHVIRTLDGPLAPIACASRTAYHPCPDCRSIKACAVRLAMTRVRDATSEILDRMSVADMVRDARQAEGQSRARQPRTEAARAASAAASSRSVARHRGRRQGGS
jgi:Rrf2 family protein